MKPSPHPVKLVLFDLDDTLFDHRHCSRSGVEAVHREFDHFVQTPLQNLQEEYQRLLDKLHPRVLTGELTLLEARDERWRRLCVWCGGEHSGHAGATVSARFREVYRQSLRPVPGALPLLQALKPLVRIGIVTNNVTEEQKGKLMDCALDSWVDFMITSEVVGEPKPGPAIFEAALRRADCLPGEAVMMGDSWSADVVGAVNSGIRAVWFNREALPIPDPSLAQELTSYEPLENVLKLLLCE